MRTPESEVKLDGMLSEPSGRLVEMMGRIDGDISILGANGKMGLSLATMARRAADMAGAKKRVIAVSRFSSPEGRKALDEAGVETISCDLLDAAAVSRLPRTENAVFMAGRKFGTEGSESLTWAINTVAPANVAAHFRGGRIVAFSTGCVYPPVSASSGGCKETDSPCPVGEYAQSCLGRERVFQHFSACDGTRVLIYRLNYACDLRYGVLYDIASKVWNGEAFRGGAGCFNTLWQGDANNYALMALEHCASPASVLNVTGPEALSVAETAKKFSKLMGRPFIQEKEFEDMSYLSDASKLFSLIGRPSVDAATLMEMQAHWLMSGGKGIGKPTHFEVNTGKY